MSTSKYAPLKQYLIELSNECHEKEMTFGGIERLLGSELPVSAKTDRTWWANTKRSNHGKRWLNAGWKVFSVDLKRKKVVFQRYSSDHIGAIETSRTPSYSKLTQFFSSLPSRQEQIALGFSELGKIIGRELPATAFHDRPWWANTRVSNHGKYWLSAGWTVENVYLSAKIVVFRRKGINPAKRIPKYIKYILEQNTSSKIIDSRTIINWINFCRKVGWYFEGTVLYERGGLSTDSLDEIEQAALEEDYGTCKRELYLPSPYQQCRKKRST